MPSPKINPSISRQLIGLRSIAISLQLITLFVAQNFFHFSLPYSEIMLVIDVYFIFNLLLWWRLHRNISETPHHIFIYLIIDVFELGALLYLSGGASNPFVFLLLYPLTITATIFYIGRTWLMALICILTYSLLIPFHHNGMAHHNENFSLHIYGMWFGFIISATLIAIFVQSLQKTIRRQEQQLSKVHEQEIKNQQLVALGTLAASTSHELGSPLGTISLLSEELSHYIENEAQQKELVQPLLNEVQRCKDILSKMSSYSGNIRLERGKKQKISEFIEPLLKNWQHRYPHCQLSLEIKSPLPMPYILSDQLLIMAVKNLLNNAQHASPTVLECGLSWDKKWIYLHITDFGSGLSKSAMQQLGKKPIRSNQDGMGIGLFLTHSIIERLGGQLKMYSDTINSGLTCQIILPIYFEA